MRYVKYFPGYALSHPDTTVTFIRNDLILIIHPDASYLTEPDPHNRAGNYYCLTNLSKILNFPKMGNSLLNVVFFKMSFFQVWKPNL